MDIGEQILQLNNQPTIDDSIKSYELVEYNPIIGTQLNNSGVITVTIENHDEFIHPHNSGLLIEGRLVKEDLTTAYGDGDKAAMVNNAISYLFSNMKYSLSGQEIESINNPGQATTMLGMLSFSDDFNKGPGLAQCWLPDTGDGAASLTTNKAFKQRHNYIITLSEPKGTFSFYVPLKDIFGFCSGYTQAMYGFRHRLDLVRKSDDDAIFRDTAAGAGKIHLQKVSWLMPKVVPNDIKKVALYKQIEDRSTFEAAFHQRQCDTFTVPETTETSWRVGVRTAPERPYFIVVGLQTARTDNQEKNPTLFDHCNVKNMSVVLNTTKYPEMDYLTNFKKMQFSQFYKAFTDFPQKYYGLDQLVSNTSVAPAEFKSLFPLYVFDVSKQSERLKQGIVDMTIKMQFHKNCAPNTHAYALILSNRMLKIRSDGQKMDVIY